MSAEDFGFLLSLLVNGASIGLMYALIALGFVLVYKATDAINFAQGEFEAHGFAVGFDGLLRIAVFEEDAPFQPARACRGQARGAGLFEASCRLCRVARAKAEFGTPCKRCCIFRREVREARDAFQRCGPFAHLPLARSQQPPGRRLPRMVSSQAAQPRDCFAVQAFGDADAGELQQPGAMRRFLFDQSGQQLRCLRERTLREQRLCAGEQVSR